MNKLPKAIAIALGLITSSATQAATPLGPSPYLSFADSPFVGTNFSYFYLENFEDGALNVPGVSADKGVVSGVGVYTDSVDADDGHIDGTGNYGHSWALYNDVTDAVNFLFDKTALGILPTHVGLVWTDLHPGTGYVQFMAYDAAGNSLGSAINAYVGDGTTLGGTAEDRFFGFISQSGISRISMTTTPGMTWEVDHLQYGVAAVPEPASTALFGTGLATLVGWRRRQSRQTGK
jgi:hypothetical protein